MRARFVVLAASAAAASAACTGHTTRALRIRSAEVALAEARKGGAWNETRGEAEILTPGALRDPRTVAVELTLMQNGHEDVRGAGDTSRAGLERADIELDGDACELTVDPTCDPDGVCYAEIERGRGGTCVLRISATDVGGHEIDRCWASVVYESDEHNSTAQAEGELDRALRECRFGD